jgi:hypothetical protein
MADTPPGYTPQATRLDWPEIDLPVLMVNAIGVQFNTEGIVLTLGQALPPLFGGPPEEQVKNLQQVGSVPVRPYGRFLLSERSVQELVVNLTAAVREHQRFMGLLPAVVEPEAGP